jgi:membrane-associated phospholipid phosphatase
VLAARQGDRWDGEGEYAWQPPAPGVYAEFREHSGTPEGFVFGAGWARAEPFTLGDPSRFRAPPPPPIDSAAYARAFAEVKELGAFDSATRTADQSHQAMWWKEFVESSHNRLARRLVREEGLDPWQAARLFALLETSLYDAYVAVFDNKLVHNHWRPYTAIRQAADDGNPATEADPAWDNLHRHTYAFPSYPSAHGAACAAAATVLADTFGAERPVTMTTERVDRAGPLSEKVPIEPASRSFPSFAAAAEECALSRVWLGIHFRYDSTAGTALGRRIGRHVVEGFLQPLAGGVRR